METSQAQTKSCPNVKPIRPSEASEWILKKHYAKRMTNVVYAYGLFNNGWLIGIVTYGIPANVSLERLSVYTIYELNRLCIDHDDETKNKASILVSHSLHAMPHPSVIVSYADIAQGHIGYVYQATNWIYTGEISSKVQFTKNGKTYHLRTLYDKHGTSSASVMEQHGYTPNKTKGKHRYVYFLGTKRDKRKMREALKWPILPYPKGESLRYNASHKPQLQGHFNF